MYKLKSNVEQKTQINKILYLNRQGIPITERWPDIFYQRLKIKCLL